ncbi:MAG: hypothetical protein ACE5NW_01390 [Acidiferrobacterales bacterium]
MQDKVSTTEYQGVERRKRVRRVNVDRRGEVRFEPKKPDRRQENGRRKEDKLWAAIRSNY